MTLEEMKYLLKRFRDIEVGLKQGRDSVVIYRGGRKERIVLDQTIKRFSDAVITTLERTEGFAKELMKMSVMEGRSDVEIYTHNKLSRNSYYHIKTDFSDLLFRFCIFSGLVAEEEL